MTAGKPPISPLLQVWEDYSRWFVPPACEQTSLVLFRKEELQELQDPALQAKVERLYGDERLPDMGLQVTLWTHQTTSARYHQ